MATLRIPEKNVTIHDRTTIRRHLAEIGIEYDYWPLDRVSVDANAEAVLAAYAPEIDQMKRKGGYTTADVIDVHPQTPGLDALLNRFKSEHTHSEDEVRFILAGRGLFFINPGGENIVSVEVLPGDLICIPRFTRHWFDLCSDRSIRAIRWFQQTSGWTPSYTQSQLHMRFEPVCFGPAHLASRVTGMR